MHCAGCAVAAFETIAEACAIDGVAVDDLLSEVDRRTDVNAPTIRKRATDARAVPRRVAR